MAFVALVAFSALHSSNGNSGWTRLDDEASSLLSVQASNSHILNEVDHSVVCQVVLDEDVVVFEAEEGDTVGQVRARLVTLCQDPTWGYSASLCNELMSELFKGDDADTLLDELQCPQVDGLVREHWQHQFAKALQQRSQPPHDVTLMQNHDSLNPYVRRNPLENWCHTKKSNCRTGRHQFKNQGEFFRAWHLSHNQYCKNHWNRYGRYSDGYGKTVSNYWGQSQSQRDSRECATAVECFYLLLNNRGTAAVGEDYDQCCKHLDEGNQEVCDERRVCPYRKPTTTPGPKIMGLGANGWKKHYAQR